MSDVQHCLTGSFKFIQPFGSWTRALKRTQVENIPYSCYPIPYDFHSIEAYQVLVKQAYKLDYY